MNNYKQIETEKILNRIGKQFFIKYYKELKGKAEFIIDEAYTENSKKVRISNGRSIFRKNLYLEALTIISESNNVDEKERQKAKQYLFDETNNFSKGNNILKKEIVFVKDAPTNFPDWNKEDLIQLYTDIMQELFSRGFVRSKKIMAEIGESLAVEFLRENYGLNLNLCSNLSQANYDAIDENGNTYQIKAVTQNETGQIKTKGKEDKRFDFLIIVRLDDSYKLEKIYKYTWEDFWNMKTRKEDNKYVIKLNKKHDKYLLL